MTWCPGLLQQVCHICCLRAMLKSVMAGSPAEAWQHHQHLRAPEQHAILR